MLKVKGRKALLVTSVSALVIAGMVAFAQADVTTGKTEEVGVAAGETDVGNDAVGPSGTDQGDADQTAVDKPGSVLDEVPYVIDDEVLYAIDPIAQDSAEPVVIEPKDATDESVTQDEDTDSDPVIYYDNVAQNAGGPQVQRPWTPEAHVLVGMHDDGHGAGRKQNLCNTAGAGWDWLCKGYNARR